MNTKLLAMIMLVSFALAGCGAKDSADAGSGAERAAESDHDEGGDEHGHEESEGEEGHVGLSAEQIEAASIEVLEAASARIRETLPLYGAIAPNAERVREVVARYPGVIRTVNRKIGDTVRQGETLATVESDESLETYAVAAPLAGVITARNANPGEQTGDKVLFTVADLSSVWVELSLFPRDLAKVHVGQQVRVTNTDAGIGADGKIVYVAPFGTATSQTLTARALLDNPQRHWAPGLYVTAEVTLAEAPVPVAVRNEALQSLEGRTVVFVKNEEGFEARSVRLARADTEHSEVLEGLDAGERYAARNSFILKAEIGKGEAEHGH